MCDMFFVFSILHDLIKGKHHGPLEHGSIIFNSFCLFWILYVISFLYSTGKGVNVVLDCVGGSMYETNVNVLAMDGRWIIYGLLGMLH